MKKFTSRLIREMNEYAAEYGVEALLEELFPEMTVGELISEMYEAGLIPTEDLEKFVGSE